MQCKLCGNKMPRFDTAKYYDKDPWVCPWCRQNQLEPADPNLLQGTPIGPDEPDPDSSWSKEKQEAWDRAEKKWREYQRREKYGRFGPRD